MSALSYDPDSGDDDPFKACAVVAGGGRIGKANDCYLLFRSYFEPGELGKEWRKDQKTKGVAVSSMYFHWGSHHDDTQGKARPTDAPVHDSVGGISSSYQLLVLHEGALLMRRHPFWCRACRGIARGGPRGGPLVNTGNVEGCERFGDDTNCEWNSRICAPKTEPALLACVHRPVDMLFRYDAYDTTEVSYMDQSESTGDPPPLSSHVVDDATQYGRIRTRPLSDSRPPKPRLGSVCLPAPLAVIITIINNNTTYI